MIQAFYMDRCHFCPSPESSKVICRSIQRKVKDFFSFFTCSMSDVRSFDRINHDALLAKTQASPAIRRQPEAWLKAGGLEDGQFAPTAAGTPQGRRFPPCW